MVNTSNGWVAPSNGEDWQAWFAEQFNQYRGLSGGNASGGAPATNGGSSGGDTSNEGNTTAHSSSEVVRLINEKRAENGLDELAYDSELSDFAEIRAVELSENNSHTRPDGTNVASLGYGENIYSAPRPRRFIPALFGPLRLTPGGF